MLPRIYCRVTEHLILRNVALTSNIALDYGLHALVCISLKCVVDRSAMNSREMPLCLCVDSFFDGTTQLILFLSAAWIRKNESESRNWMHYGCLLCVAYLHKWSICFIPMARAVLKILTPLASSALCFNHALEDLSVQEMQITTVEEKGTGKR